MPIAATPIAARTIAATPITAITIAATPIALCCRGCRSRRHATQEVTECPLRTRFLAIEAESQPDAYVIRIAGELDLGGCPALESALQGAERAHADRIIVDLEALTFIDSVGLRTLLQASRRSASNGNRLQITRGKGHPAKMFRLTGLDEALPLTDPCLCPAVHDAGYAPDDSNRPRTGEDVLVGPTAWR